MRQQLTKESFSDEIFDDAFLFSGIAHEEYLASYMNAIELYMLYKENKDKALDTLKRIILLDEMNEEELFLILAYAVLKEIYKKKVWS